MTTPHTRRAAAFLLALITGSLSAWPALADDTEVYLGTNSGQTQVRPNVLFIMDTSGSMDTDVTTTVGVYDPTQTYSGSCDPTRYYWSSNGSPPSCSTYRYIDVSSFKCADASTALGSGGNGYYVGRLGRYRNRRHDRWDSFSWFNHSDPVECAADFGVHGDGIDTTKLYPADENHGGPWRADSTGAVDWSSTGDDYTIYSANYLNWRESPGTTVTQTRLQIVKETLKSLLDGSSGINAGLMRFDSNAEGGYFLEPVKQLDTTHRASMKSAVDSLSAHGGTPLAETMYESGLFFRSQPVDYGDSSSPGTNNPGVLDSSDTSKYKTPIEYQCQKNFAVLLTDGEPTSDNSADNKIAGMPGFSNITGKSSCTGDCLDEMAQYLHDRDLNSSLNDAQNVISYTIGFASDQQLLKDTAAKGGGKYYLADSADSLATAFTSIITEVLAVNTTFVAPAVTANAFNRLTHRDELYFALFKPSSLPRWHGNVKRYGIAGDPPIVVDAHGDSAVDVNTGFFASGTQSFWSTVVDGSEVKLGGAASKLTTSRNLYTFTGGSVPNNVSLTASANAFSENNSALSKTLLGISGATDAYRIKLLQWARGIDVDDENENGSTTDARHFMGDPLHTKPALVTYGGTDTNPDITLFASTNEGFLHAIDTSNGTEQFAFMPQALLPNIDTLYTDSATADHPYGMDGPITVWHKDVNHDGLVLNTDGSVQSGEHVYLYAGMRRGGDHYYALDVTDRTAPKLMWRIDGGTGDFAMLGQTWSRPIFTKVKINGVEKQVLIFGGGYDTTQDTTGTARTADSIGNAIYMIDATTGARLWWAGPAGSGADLELAGMTNAFPADPRVIDINLDGDADRLYMADVGGRLWRLDFDNQTNTGAGNLATGYMMADFNDGATVAGNRHFYYPPDVALIQNGTQQFLSVAVGSGYRAHPLDEAAHDRFYMIRDNNVYGPPTDGGGNISYPATLTESDLYDATANLIGQGTSTQQATAVSQLNGSSGWYIKLNKADGSWEGEKVLAESLTVQNQILFTTFTPVVNTASQNSCAPSQGTAKTYRVNLLDATPVKNYDQVGSADALTRSDRAVGLARGGIPPEPVLLFPSGGNAVVMVGPEKLPDFNLNLTSERTKWEQIR